MSSTHSGASVAPFARRFGLSDKLVAGYDKFYRDNGASHELTISLGCHPRQSFNPEVDFIPIMRRIVFGATHAVRGVPKRKLEKLKHQEFLWMAGFYEHTDAAGMVFPHWHGVVALNAGEERKMRTYLEEKVGIDGTEGFETLLITSPSRSVVKYPGSKPSFHLVELNSQRRYIRYSGKKVEHCEPVFWATAHFLHKASEN